MDIGRQLHFGCHGDVTTWNGNPIGLFESNLKMRRVDGVGYFFSKLREKFRDQAISGNSLPVFRVEKLLFNDSLGVDKEIPRPGHAFVLSDGFGVQHLVSGDDLGIRVGQQGKLNLATVREILQYFDAVVANRYQRIPCSSNRALAPSSSTSWPLQYGHQSTERKNRSTVPCFPLSVSRFCSCPNWSGAEKPGPSDLPAVRCR